MKNRKNVLKEASVILIIVSLVLSSNIVIGQNENKQTKLEKCLTEVSHLNNNIINNEPITSGRTILWDNGLPDGVNLAMSVYWPPADYYVIDDFSVYPGCIVTDGHFRMIIAYELGPEDITNVRYYFFKNSGPCAPGINPISGGTTTFQAHYTGNTYFGRPEIAVDCQFPPLTLTPGDYWVCFQPAVQDGGIWLGTTQKGCSIFIDYAYLGYPRWTWGYIYYDKEFDVSWRLTGNVLPEPAISCEGLLHWDNVKTGSTVNGTFQVCNSGEPGSLLNWEVASYPSWGSWTLTPSNGTGLAEGDCVTISVEVVAPPTKKKTFTGKIKMINSDHPTDFCEIDVTLITPRARTINGFSFMQLIFEKYPNLFLIFRHILA